MPQFTFEQNDIPESEWPGEWITQAHIAQGCGDPRDWFKPATHLAYARDAWRAYCNSPPATYDERFKFKLVILDADVGGGKTSSVARVARRWFGRGHPFFHDGGFHFGRYMQKGEIYDSVAKIPLYSIVSYDEAHSSMEGRMGGTEGVASTAQLMAALRKKHCQVYMSSAIARLIDKTIRGQADEVWRPIKPQIVSDSDQHYPRDQQHCDPKNFVLAVEVYKYYPFRRQDPRNGGRNGFGQPDYTLAWQGESVRRAFALTSTFIDMEPITARKFATRGHREAQEKETALEQSRAKLREAVYYAINQNWEVVTPSWLAQHCDLSAQSTGKELSALFGHVQGEWKTKKGLQIDVIRDTFIREWVRVA